MMKWKVRTSQYLYKRDWLTIREEKVELPNGNTIDSYYILDYPTWITVLGITREGLFVLVRQYRHGNEKVAYELCAGVCDEGESPMESAKRELLEETGYGGGKWKEWTVCSPNPGTHSNLNYCFLATDLVRLQDQQLDPTEDISVHLLTYDEVVALLQEDGIIQAMHALPLWKYVALKNTLKI